MCDGFYLFIGYYGIILGTTSIKSLRNWYRISDFHGS